MIGYYSLGLTGYQINSIEYGIDDYVKFQYVGTQTEQREQKRKIYYNAKGEPYFNTGNRRIYFKDCMKGGM